MSIFPFSHDTLGFSELSRSEVLRIHVKMENVTAYGVEIFILSLASGTGKRMIISIVANHLRKKIIFDDFHPPQLVSRNDEHKNYVADLYGLLQGTVLKDVDEYEDVIGRTEDGKDRSLNTFLIEIPAYKHSYLGVSLFPMLVKHKGRKVLDQHMWI
jgi:hypothetical protein